MCLELGLRTDRNMTNQAIDMNDSHLKRTRP